MINCIHLTLTVKPLYSARCHQMIFKKAIHSLSLEYSKYFSLTLLSVNEILLCERSIETCFVLLVVLNKSWDFSWVLE